MRGHEGYWLPNDIQYTMYNVQGVGCGGTGEGGGDLLAITERLPNDIQYTMYNVQCTCKMGGRSRVRGHEGYWLPNDIQYTMYNVQGVGCGGTGEGGGG